MKFKNMLKSTLMAIALLSSAGMTASADVGSRGGGGDDYTWYGQTVTCSDSIYICIKKTGCETAKLCSGEVSENDAQKVNSL